LGLSACNNAGTQEPGKGKTTRGGLTVTAPVDIGQPLFHAAPVAATPAPTRRAADPIVVEDCRLVVDETQEVPAEHEGVLLFIGTDVKESEKVPDDQLIKIKVGNEEKRFRKLKEGDLIEKGQLLGLVDDQMARDELAIKEANIGIKQAE